MNEAQTESIHTHWSIRFLKKLFHGMPSGIPYIIGNETAERFSYYGMKAILAVFMTQYLMMTESKSNEWFHLFGSAVYLTPIFGAFLSDIFLGKYRTILYLSIIYCLGHLVLALNDSENGLFWGLTFIAIGSGGIKPCVSAHVGDQFREHNKHLINKVFSFFYFAINFGSAVSTLAIPYMLDVFGPQVAFGIPGLLMFLATFVFWLGRHKFVHIPPFGKDYLKVVFSKEGLSAIGRLMIIYAFIAIFWALYEQTGSTWIFQSQSPFLDKEVSLFFFHFTLLPSQIQAINPLLVMILIPLFSFLIYPLLERIIPLRPLIKISIGMFVTALSYLVVAYIEGRISQGIHTNVMWQFLAYVILTMAEVMVYATALEFSYTQAPNQMKSTIMGLFLFSVSMGNIIITLLTHYNSLPSPVKSITSGKNTSVTLKDSYVVLKGEKIEFNEGSGMFFIQKNSKTNQLDTLPLNGTFLVGNINPDNSFTIENNSRESISTIRKSKQTSGFHVVFHRFKHEAYFYMYALLMFITAILFIGVAIKYKGKTYIQEEPDQIPT
jgi:POT family proton-dependent oligopeptide transporter